MGNNDLRNGDLGDIEWDNGDLPNGESEPNQTKSSSSRRNGVLFIICQSRTELVVYQLRD